MSGRSLHGPGQRLRRPVATAAAASLLVAFGASAETLRLEATRDNSIVIYPGEETDNAGGQIALRIKGNQHIVALAFDMRPLAGRTARAAILRCRKGNADIDAVTISTIQADWDEMRSNALTSGLLAAPGWGAPGIWFPAVTGGNSGSLVCHAKSVVKNGWYEWPVAPDLVNACAIGAAFGLAVHEAGVDYSRNPTIYSREDRSSAPHLVVEVGPAEGPPGPPTGLELRPGADPELTRLALTAPRSGLAYEVEVNGRPLPRCNIPFVRPGERQIVFVRDVPVRWPVRLEVSVRTLSRSGARSAAARVSCALPAPRKRSLPEPPPLPPSAGPAQEGFAVLPPEDRYDEGGRPLGELPPDYLARNEVFDGRTVRLAAAKGEVVGFQVLMKGKGRTTLACELGGLRVDVFRALYVDSPKGRVPDPLVRDDTFELSTDRWAVACVDVYVPFEFEQRTVTGRLSLSDGRALAVELTVRNFALPREASFLCEMNSYGLPDRTSEFYRLQEIAYDHRVHCNILHYPHSTAAPGARKCNMDMLLPDGRRMDERRYNDIAPGAERGFWDDFIAAFGPYLSGSHFERGHRGPIPAPGFYLTFHESWPLNVRAYWNGNLDAHEAFAHAPVYAKTFVNIMRDFIRVAREQGWTRTGFQVFLNNKGSPDDPRKAPWVLDEPASLWDYRALAYYGGLAREAKGESCPVVLRYRIDISRPEFDRGELAGCTDMWVVATGAFKTYNRLVLDRAELAGGTIWVYGGSTPPEESSRNILAWALGAYRDGASGLVPWETINRDGSALKKSDELGLFIFEGRPGTEAAIHHSIRLKAYRRAQQDIEYLELVRKKLSLSAGELRAFIDHYIDLDGRVDKRFAEDAGTARFGRLVPEGFRRLREAASMLVEGAASPEARAR